VRLTLVALASVALLAGGCGHSTTRPGNDVGFSYARVVGITVQVDRMTGDGRVPVTIHWLPRDCSEQLEDLDVRIEPGYQTLVTMRTRFRFSWICADGAFEELDTTIVVPRERLVIVGLGGASEFRIADPAPDVEPGVHAVCVLRRGSFLPEPGVVVEHGSYVNDPDPLATATTDTTGWAVSSPGCPLYGTTYLGVNDPGYGWGRDVVQFTSAMWPCTRALRTYLLYGPTPPTPD